MHASYSYLLVAVSVCVGALAGYSTLDLASRIAILTSARARRLWLAGGASSLGIGIWSMHFVGMLSMSLPIDVGYDIKLTALSLLIAIGTSYCGLSFMTRPSLSAKGLMGGALLVGVGIGGMHYTGMAAMLMSPGIVYDPKWFLLSVAEAVAASYVALYVARKLIASKQDHIIRFRVLGAILLGVNITGVHYTGMAAATFLPGAICGAATQINTQWLAATVTLFMLAIMVVSVLLTLYDRRTASLAGSLSDLSGQIVRMATYDSLTDLPNRHTFGERIDTAIKTFAPQKQRFAILFMDIDGFKAVNDSLGHSVGDRVLKAFARRLLNCVSGSDTVARVGGGAFAVLLQNDASAQSAETMAQTILKRMRMHSWDDEHPFSVTPSIGISLFPQDGRTVDEIIKHAEAAMYEAKRQERGTYRFFEAAMNEAAERTLQVQHALHEALAKQYFSLHYQPKFSGGDSRFLGAEALLRLRHPTLGSVAPMDFIPIAERSGQIVQIGYWVVREACRQIQAWRAEGLPAVKIAVNLSPAQLVEPDLIANMLALLHAGDVEPQYIMFEITESVAMQDAAKTVDTVKRFQALGFDIAIDDFGTGYSSLAYLQRFRVRQLKIDRFFVNGLDVHGAEGSAIVAAIIGLAHSLNMEVVAEGVETESQLTKLQEMMCDQIQGYLLGKPVTASEFTALLQNQIALPCVA